MTETDPINKRSHDPPTASKSTEWLASSIGRLRFGLLMALVLAQGATLWFCWPLFQVRSAPMVNLPVVELPPVGFGGLLMASLAVVLLAPRYGVFVHLVLLAISFLFDQFRMQPQFIGIAMLMLATIGPRGEQVVRWHLTALWFWAGMHKFLSPDWFGYRSWNLTVQAELSPENNYLVFAASVVIVELALAVMAIVRPRIAAFVCVAMHTGIALLMSRWGLNMNGSVIPWNLCVALIGGWLFYRLPSPNRPADHLERVMALLFLIVPAGFYFGLVDRCFCHVLYSGNLPQAVITTGELDELGQPVTRAIQGWGELEVPFPKERRLLRKYFELTAEPGERMHIYEPRKALPDLFFEYREQVAHKVSRSYFFETDEQGHWGVGVDNLRSLFVLQRNNARLLKRNQSGPVYAVAIQPSDYRPELMAFIGALPNLEQIQLAGCPVSDGDLVHLKDLKRLTGIGLENTLVTDQGLEELARLPMLRAVFFEGSQITEARLTELGLNPSEPSD